MEVKVVRDIHEWLVTYIYVVNIQRLKYFCGRYKRCSLRMYDDIHTSVVQFVQSYNCNVDDF